MRTECLSSYSKLYNYFKVSLLSVISLFLLLTAVSLPISVITSPAGAATIASPTVHHSSHNLPPKITAFGQPGNKGLSSPLLIGSNLNLDIRLSFILKSSHAAFSSPNPQSVSQVKKWLARYRIKAVLEGSSLNVSTSAGTVTKLLHNRFYIYPASSGGTNSRLKLRALLKSDSGAVLPSNCLYAFGQPYLPGDIARDLLTIVGLNNTTVTNPAITLLPRLTVRHGSDSASPKDYSVSANPILPKSKTPSSNSSALTQLNSQSGVTACSSAVNYSNQTGFSLLSTIGKHYGISQLLAQGDAGAGVTIGVAELGEANSGDIASYDQCFGLSQSNVSVINVDGGGPAGLDTLEADSDIEQLQTNAPQAKIISYNGPNLDWSTLYDVVNAMVNPPTGDPLPQIISISYGGCESESGDVMALSALFAQAAAQGQSVFVASGDAGSEACRNEPDTLAVNYPASDPNVTSVGGSEMINSGITNGSGDIVWNDCQNSTDTSCSQDGFGGAGGGGVSSLFPEPSFQTNSIGLESGSCGSSNGGCRAVPDISGDAIDNAVYYEGNFAGVDGTSLSAPLLAAITADIAPTCNSAIGDLAPRLYAYYHSFGYQMALNPITSGNNDWTGAFGGNNYQASDSYNLATGLGTLDAPFLVCPSVSSLSSSSSPPGSQITIQGNNLLDASVTFGSIPASIVSRSNTSLSVTVPSGQGYTSLGVSSPIGSAGSLNFSYSNPAIIVNTTSPYLATIGNNLNIPVSSYGNPTATITETGNLPSGVQFISSATGTAAISGTPAAGSSGNYQITLTATNALGSQSTSLVLTVGTPPNIAAPSDVTTAAGQQLNITLAAGSPQPSIGEVNGSSLPSGISINQNKITGTVANSTPGNYVLSFTAANSFGSVQGSLLITVMSPPAPVTTTAYPAGQLTSNSNPSSSSISLKSFTAVIRGRQILLDTSCKSQYCEGGIVISRGKLVLAKSDFRIGSSKEHLIRINLNNIELHRVRAISSKFLSAALAHTSPKKASLQKGLSAKTSQNHMSDLKIRSSLDRRYMLSEIKIPVLLTITLNKRIIRKERLLLGNQPVSPKKPIKNSVRKTITGKSKFSYQKSQR